MNKIQNTVYVILPILLIIISSSTWAQTLTSNTAVKLGIEIKQGDDASYISNLDPNEIGAAAGLMIDDKIREIANVAVWFNYQVKWVMKYRKRDKPFNILITRNGTLHRITIDPRKPTRSWIKKKGKDSLFDCYFTPTRECFINTVMKPQKTTGVSMRFYSHVSRVKSWLKLGRTDLAKSELEQLKKTLFLLSDFEYKINTILGTLKSMGKKPDKKILTYIKGKLSYKKDGSLNTHALLYASKYLGQFGEKEAAMSFLMMVVNAAKAKPDIIKEQARRMGSALAATGKYELMKFYLKSKKFDSKWGSLMLEEAFLYHIKEEDLKSAEKVLKIILTTPRSKTNGDDLIFIRMFKKVRKHEIVSKLINNLRMQTEKMDPLFQLILARSLVSAYGADGNIRMGRRMIKRYFSRSPLRPMLDLTIESANSRNSLGLAVQYYKDLPKLISDTYQLLKASSTKERKRNKRTINEFYKVMAAHLGNSFTIQEYDAYGFDQFEYGKLIDTFIEVRKYDEALKWTEIAEKKFGKIYRYYVVFAMFGHSAPHDKIEVLKRHPQFKNNENIFKLAYMERLYWRGYVDKASAVFNTLSRKIKIRAIKNQLPFVSKCSGCNL